MHLNGRTLSTTARQNLAALAVSLEMLVALVGLEASGSPKAGTAMQTARKYFTERHLDGSVHRLLGRAGTRRRAAARLR